MKRLYEDELMSDRYAIHTSHSAAPVWDYGVLKTSLFGP
jgi:hypothetical protein